jgi:hypothetical protein
MKTIKNLFLLLCLAAGAFACDDQFEDDLVRDNRPEVPITYPGATTYGFNPYYTASISDTATTAPTLTVQMAIPENSPRNIQEITKVIVGATSINAGNVTNPARASIVPAIPVGGKSAAVTMPIRTFYLASGKLSAAEVTTLNNPTGYVERALMFLVTLDDGSQIVPVQVRVRFTR